MGRLLWKISKALRCPIDHEYIRNINDAQLLWYNEMISADESSVSITESSTQRESTTTGGSTSRKATKRTYVIGDLNDASAQINNVLAPLGMRTFGAARLEGMASRYGYEPFLNEVLDQFSGNFNNLELVNPTDNVFLIGQESKLITDASFGFNFNLNRFNIGFSTFNLLESRVSDNSIQSNNNNLKRQYQLLCSYSIPIDSFIVLEPKMLVKSLETGIYHGDILLSGRINDIYILGLSHRIGAAWSFIAGIEYIKDKDGKHYTYDINTNTNYNSIAERKSNLKGMDSIATFLYNELRK